MSQVVHLGLQLLWIVWLPATVALAVRALGARLPAPGAARRATVALLALGAAAAALALVLPFRVDASGLMELAPLDRSSMHLKGTAGKALVDLIALLGVGGHRALIGFTRASFVLAPLLVGALVAGSPRREAFAAGLVLCVSPLFLHSVLGTFNFWFYPLLVLGVLLALEEQERGPSAAASLALASGVGLIGFSRPETMVAAGLLGLYLYVRAARRRRRFDAVALGLVLVLFAWAAAELAGFLLDRVRNQPLLMGSDAAPAAAPGQKGPLPLVMLRRLVTHLPRDLVLLLVMLHGLALLAVARLVTLVRARRATPVEMAAVVLFLVEFAAIALHREGFFKLTKYGMLVAVPIWYLAARRRLPLMEAGPRRRWTRLLVVAALVVGVGYTALDWTGWGAPHGWRVPARADTVLWKETPRLAGIVCGGRGAGAPATVLVLGLDERRAMGVGIRWLGIEAAHWESDLWPLPLVLRHAGCRTITRYPPTDLPLERVLRGGGPEPDLLCGAAPLDGVGGPIVGPPGAALDAAHPTHILITYLEPSRRRELERALAAAPACPWQVERDLGNAVLLDRRSPPPAAAGAGSQPAAQPGDGARQGRR